MSANELFSTVPARNQPPVTPDEDPVIALVGEGKKFKDTAALARGKLEADRHISNLEGEMQALRQELEQRISLEKFLDRLDTSPEPKKETTTPPPVSQPTTLTPEDIRNAVKQEISTERDISQRQSNVAFVRRELEKAWGDKFPAKLEQAASEFGGKDFLASMAEKNPKAFLKLLGVGHAPMPEPINTETVTPPTSTVSFGSAPASSGKGYKSFEKMRKEDPKRYWSPANQNEMHKLAEQMGESFYN